MVINCDTKPLDLLCFRFFSLFSQFLIPPTLDTISSSFCFFSRRSCFSVIIPITFSLTFTITSMFFTSPTTGAQDSTYIWYTLGTSFRVLRMLTESGDAISYIFLVLASLRPFILDVQGEGRPNCSWWDFIRVGG